jgi:flagellar biosynthesis protein FliR
MSHITLADAIRALGGTGQVTAFFLVLARVTPLFILAPLFSSKMLAVKVRGILAVALSIGLTPVAMHGQHVPSGPFQVAALVIEGLLVGLAFSFSVGVVFAAVDAAGHLIDNVSGFSFGATVDPINGNQGGVMASLYGLVGTAIFIAIGGDAWTLRGLARTFTLVPLTRGPQLRALTAGVSTAFSSILTSALEVAAPAMLALLITDVAFGMVSRVVPQLNVFGVGFPVKVGVALLIVSAALPFLGGWMSGQLTTSVASALTSLHIA